MAATFSVNDGQIIESMRKQNVFSVLNELPDNTKKLISPKDVRDAFFTTWASSPIKITTPGISSTEYIGVDSSNPSDRDLKKVIFLGKRSYGNLEVMNSSLLNTNTADIFIYNTKPDLSNQDVTKVSILAGTDSSLWYYAPYISSIYSSSLSKIDMNLVNPSPVGGDINIVSSSGRVGINGIVFPTLSETSASASNGKILRYYGTYPSGYLRWDDATVTLSSIGSPNTPTNIYGSVVNVNGYPLEFINDGSVPNDIGDILQGASFSAGSFNGIYGTQNWPITEVIRKILYPYIEPVLSLSVTNTVTGTTYAEVGTTASVLVNAAVSIYARDSSEFISDWTLTGTTYSHSTTNGFSYTRIDGPYVVGGLPGTQFSLIANGSTYSQSNNSFVNYTFAVSNSSQTASSANYLFPVPFGFSYSVSSSINFISPFILKFDSGNSLTPAVLSSFISSTYSTKAIKPYPGLSQSIKMKANGTGYLHFTYPFSYGLLKMIKDTNGYIIHDVTTATSSLYTSFTYSSSITPFTPYNYYSTYRMYRTKLPCSYTGSGEFEFIF
jgi:hypothetical protein